MLSLLIGTLLLFTALIGFFVVSERQRVIKAYFAAIEARKQFQTHTLLLIEKLPQALETAKSYPDKLQIIEKISRARATTMCSSGRDEELFAALEGYSLPESELRELLALGEKFRSQSSSTAATYKTVRARFIPSLLARRYHLPQGIEVV